jgi:hypothetical protein
MHDLTVWRVSGEAATGSHGGAETWLYATSDEVALPDVAEEFQPPSAGSRRWYRVDRIERLGALGPIDPDTPLGQALLAALERTAP